MPLDQKAEAPTVAMLESVAELGASDLFSLTPDTLAL